VPAGKIPVGPFDYCVSVETGTGETIRHPANAAEWLTARVVQPSAPLTLFDAARDIPSLIYTRIGDTVRHGIFKNLPANGADPAALRLMFPLSLDRTLDDYTASLAVKDRLTDRRGNVDGAKAMHIKARSSGGGRGAVITLVEADGTAWSTGLGLSAEWRDIRVRLDQLQIAQSVLLPLGYPGRWNYWCPPAQGRGGVGDHLRTAGVEHVQISIRPAPVAAGTTAPEGDAWVDIAAVKLEWE